MSQGFGIPATQVTVTGGGVTTVVGGGGGGGGGDITVVHLSSSDTVASTDNIVSLEAAITATMHGSPTEGETHLVKRKLTSGTPTIASGTAGNFWRDGVTASDYDLESDGAQVGFYWDGTHWVVTGMSGVLI